MRGQRSDAPFFAALAVLGGAYVLLVAAMVLADLTYTSPGHLLAALRSADIRHSIQLSLFYAPPRRSSRCSWRCR